MNNTYNVLFLCHDNAGRSLMAEAMLNKMGHGRFNTYSAGSEPSSAPHPIAIEILQKEGFDVNNLKPKHLDVFHANDAPKMNLVITLCTNSQKEAVLTEWENQPVTAHWHFEDPHAEVLKSKENNEEYHHYDMVQRLLSNRLHLLLNYPDVKLEEIALKY